MTIHQHYIPRMILKRWNYWHIPMSNPFRYEIKKNGKKKKKRVDRVIYHNTLTGYNEIKDTYGICYKDCLHEYTKDGQSVDSGVIENHFSRLENIWTNIIDRVEQKSLLSDTDVIWLKILVIKQLMRTPEAISLMSQTLKMLSPTQMTKEEADRYYKISAFAINIQVEAQWMFWSYFKYYAGHSKLAIFHTDDNFILCDERPVLCTQLENMKPTMYLPISPQYMLGLIYDSSFDKQNEDKVNTNYEYIKLDSNSTQWFNNQIYKCGTHIISNNFISKGE